MRTDIANSTRRSAPQIAESVFDTLYLTASLTLAAALLATGRTLWGCAVATLFVGDSLHLIPRIYRFATGVTSPWEKRGKLAASIAMTVFYLLIWWQAALTWGYDPVSATSVFALVAVRIALCFLPHSFDAAEPSFASWLRNVPFIALGAIVATEYGMASSLHPFALGVSLAIAASFAFYIPVIVAAKRKPSLGALMLPKSCAYLAIAALGFAF